MKAMILLPLALLALSPLAAAPPKAEDAPAPHVSTLVVFGDDPCPRSKNDEIVVCARQPESDRYRIPKQFRKKHGDDLTQSWAARARTMDVVSQRGLPNSCSPIGSNGQTGCYRQFLEAARAEREAMKQEQGQ